MARTAATSKDEIKKSPRRRANILLRLLGPGLVTGAADDDPSGIATYSQAGAQFGYGLLWTVFLTTPFMIAIQLVSAHIGRVTGKGIVANVKDFAPRWVVVSLVSLLVLANTFNIAADLAAMGEALSLVIGGLNREHALIFAAISVLLQVFVRYRALCARPEVSDPGSVPIRGHCLHGAHSVGRSVRARDLAGRRGQSRLFVHGRRGARDDHQSLPLLLASIPGGREDEAKSAGRPVGERRPLKDLSRGGEPEIERMALDTSLGMVFSNLIAFFIILTTAAVLNAAGVTDIQSAAQAAEALRPLAGELTFVLFALGIIGTGLLAVPVLAGSAAYGVSEAFGWPATLEAKAPDAVGFYGIIAGATIVGLALGYTPIDPIQMLVWSAVLNGIVAVPIMAIMMVVVTRLSVMGRFNAKPVLAFFGWAGTVLMAVTVVALIWSWLG